MNELFYISVIYTEDMIFYLTSMQFTFIIAPNNGLSKSTPFDSPYMSIPPAAHPEKQGFPETHSTLKQPLFFTFSRPRPFSAFPMLHRIMYFHKRFLIAHRMRTGRFTRLRRLYYNLLLQDADQLVYVRRVQARGGFVQHVQGLARRPAGEFRTRSQYNKTLTLTRVCFMLKRGAKGAGRHYV